MRGVVDEDRVSYEKAGDALVAGIIDETLMVRQLRHAEQIKFYNGGDISRRSC